MRWRRRDNDDASTMMTLWQWRHNDDNVRTTTMMTRTMTTRGPWQRHDDADDTMTMTLMTWRHDNNNMTMQWWRCQCDDEADNVMTLAWRSRRQDDHDGDDMTRTLRWHNDNDMATMTTMTGQWWHDVDDGHDNKTIIWQRPREHFSLLLCVRWGLWSPKPHLAEAEGVFSLILGCFWSRS